jgi:hypothetical protein
MRRDNNLSWPRKITVHILTVLILKLLMRVPYGTMHAIKAYPRGGLLPFLEHINSTSIYYCNVHNIVYNQCQCALQCILIRASLCQLNMVVSTFEALQIFEIAYDYT